jgi:serine/threonine protein kinase/tetratricopeptide (TPR) repeat protein
MTVAEGLQFGPYRMIEKIGSGGMGEVYRALDTRLEREVALKLISQSYLGLDSASPSGTPTPADTPISGSQLSHERFLREARSAATLNHPHVCSIYDTGQQDGRPYLVMELLRGETLKQYLAKRGGKGLSPDEVIAFSQQAAAALAAAHRKGIIHRDIKPANLFVVEGERGKRVIKILDFGLAKKQPDSSVAQSRTFDLPGSNSAETQAGTALDLTSPGATLGTAAYMSPEQARGEPLDARTDLFSLGSVIYEMATGKAPFAAASAAELFVALLTQTAPPVSSVNPAMPKRLDPIVAKLLAKEPAQRYADADALLVALDGLDAHASGTTAVAGVPPNRRKWVIAAIVLLLVGGGLAWWKLRPAAAPAATPDQAAAPASVAGTPEGVKNSIILADFINHTGDSVFDTTLNQALQIDLEQSPVITIVSQQHLAQSVKYLGKPADTPVTPEIAREIGIREGVKAILTGTIANLGKQYVITLSAQNTATGDEIVDEQAQSPDKEHVLDALSRAVSAMRSKLGEDLASIKKLDTPFGQATTGSLEAFRAFALGDKAHEQALDIPEAEGHYLRAIAIDPKFALAYARLGVVYSNSGQTAKAHTFYERAYELSQRVSEGERIYIEGHYHLQVTGNFTKVVEILQEGIQTYPTQIANYINIGSVYSSMGQYEQALPFALKATQLDPQDTIAAENLLDVYIALNRMPEIRAEQTRELSLGMDKSSESLSGLIASHFVLGEPQGVQAVLTQAAGRPEEFVVTQVYALTQMYAGQYREGSATMTRAFQQAGRANAPDVQANILLTNAEARGLAGLCDDSEAALRQALVLDKSKQTEALYLLAAAVCGHGKLAIPVAQELTKKFPEDTLIHNAYAPLMKAFNALAEGRPQEAIDEAEPAKPYDVLFPASYVQGLAYLQLHDAAHAQAAFRSAMRSPAGCLTSFCAGFYAQAQLGLARSYVLGGDKVSAKTAYDAFFATWKNADVDLPMLIAAKKEYAGL